MSTTDSALLQALLDATRGIGIRGGYKPGGTSGGVIREIIAKIRPSLYPFSGDREHVDLDALAYALERLPEGIEACRVVDIVRDETPYAQYPPIPVGARREIAFRPVPDQMVLVVKGGKIRILDRVTMITCLYIEGQKLAEYADRNRYNWDHFTRMFETATDPRLVFIQLSRITGNPVEKLVDVDKRLKGRLPRIVHDLGKRALDGLQHREQEMIVTFSNDFLQRPTIGDITETWLRELEGELAAAGYAEAPVCFVSANLSSFLAVLSPAFPGERSRDLQATYGRLESLLSDPKEKAMFLGRSASHPAIRLRENVAATGLGYQVFLLDLLKRDAIDPWLAGCCEPIGKEKAALVVMDYPFGDDAFYYLNDVCKHLGRRLRSVGVMGRAAVFSDAESCVLLPRAFVREGDPQCIRLATNALARDDFQDMGVEVLEGNMLTVLGTFLQTRDMLEYFSGSRSSYRILGLEMEGLHFANALESASLRGWIPERLPAHFAYYKSDNPLNPHSTLSQQLAGGERVVPKYAVTLAMVRKVLGARPV